MTAAAAAVTLVVLLPLALFVLQRRPEDMGLSPDGLPQDQDIRQRQSSNWGRADALRTSALQTTMIAFGLGMSVQIGLLTHQATLLAQSLPTGGIAAIISATAIAALVGRLGLAKFADSVDARVTSSAILIMAAASFCALAVTDNPVVLIGASLLFGFTVGNVTTLSPIIVRREFGAAAFGPVFGVASCAIQLITALGPGFYGLLHDTSGGYREPLLVAATLDVIAAIAILCGRRGVAALS
jgi:predicted MFS family arabinose efflux permease